LFAAASLACGLAGSIGVLVAARAVQGIGAAIISPATLSIIMTTFEEGSERDKALGIWGAMGGSGAAAGVLFGGILTKYAGWEWVFFVNVPVAVLVLAVTRAVVRESRITGIRAREAGLASGLINTSQQIGGALGVAIAATVAFTHTNTLLHAGHNPAAAQTGGFALGFWVIAGFGAAAVLATLALVRSSEVALDVETAEAF
jgi:MFS family permease